MRAPGWFWLVLALALFGLLPATADARQVALVVGIARYERVASLKNPERDAAAVADRFRDLGFEVIEAFNADRFSLERARKRFLDAARGADLALFYFAGHGIQLFDRNVLIARDADPATARGIDELGLDMTRLMADLRSAGPVRTALLIDACRDNPLAFEETVALLRRLQPATDSGATTAGATRSAAAKRGLSSVTLPAKGVGAGETLVFFAAQPGQVSYDGEGRNSVFVEGLREALGSVGRPMSEQFRAAGAYVRTVTKGAQVPQLVSDWTGDVVLGRDQGRARVRYLNTSSAKGLDGLSEADARIVGELARPYPVFSGRFIVEEGQAFTDSWLNAGPEEKARAKAIGNVNGFAIDYDIDRDGREETLAVYVLQTNVVMTMSDEGITLRDSPCWDFDKEPVEAVTLALRDINGDRKPEVFVFYRKELGGWGNLCVMEYIGNANLANLRRGGHATNWSDASLFRVLLRHEGAWTVSVGEDNSIETCAGSNCHTRSAYSFDGTHFRMTLDESEKPSAPKARPFRNQAEREAWLQPSGNAPANAPASHPSLTPPAAPSASAAEAIGKFIAEVYLPSGNSGASIRLNYEPAVSYYGKTVSNTEIERDKARYVRKWPQRRYSLVPGTLEHKAAGPGLTDVSFEYLFEVRSGSKSLAGRGRARLRLRAVQGGFALLSEDGEVIARQ